MKPEIKIDKSNRADVIAALANKDLRRLNELMGIKKDVPTYFTALNSGIYLKQDGSIINEDDMPTTDPGYIDAIIVTYSNELDFKTLKKIIDGKF